ncbi:MAG: PKD domain-containing protein, partial [Bacteroidales bacterium]|nr:PKD domain-containing protein [Bacteroidales bacterium]
LVYSFTTIDNCTGTAQRTVDVIPMPETPLGIAVDNNGYCIADKPTNIQLSITNVGSSFKWYRNQVLIDSLIGDLTTLTVNAPDTTTTYLVRSETSCGESSTESIIVYVFASPISDYLVDDVCKDVAANFVDQSSMMNGSITAWTWDFGDGNSSSNNSPAPHLYATPGVYTTSLLVESADNCQSLLTKDLEVFPLPEDPLGIAVDNNDYCLADKPNAIVLSITNIGDEFLWYENEVSLENLIGDNTTLGILAPDTTTTYLVRSENDCGVSSLLSITVNVFPSPTADFSFADACQKDDVNFNDLSSIPYGSINSWSWNFGDGQSTTGEIPNPNNYHTYGTFAVELTVSTADACESVTTKDIIIHPKPMAGFTFDEVCKGFATTFVDQSDGYGSSVISHSWNFDHDAGSSNEINPTFIFNDWGLNDVELIVNTDFSCKDTLVQQVLVDSLALPSFTFDNPCKSNAVTYTDASDSNGKTITSWSWDFGDGSSSNQANAIHVYGGVASFYDVTLSLTDSKGCTNISSIENVYVNPDFSVSIIADQFCVNREENLQAISNDANITMDSWEWIVDGNSYSTLDNIQLNYANPGLHEVQLVGTLVSNGKPCTSGDLLNIEVNNLPNTDFNFDTPNLDFPTQFTDATILDDPDASIDSWAWNFQDNGAASSLQNPSHLFSIDGSYLVELYVLDDNSCEKTIQKEVVVNPKPGANFLFTKECEGFTTVFTDISSSEDGPIQSYQWDFGEASSGADNFSNLKDPEHHYSQAGSYQVKLIVEGFGYDTVTKNVVVYHLPETQFGWSVPCLNEKISLTDQSISGDGDLAEWIWTISDGSTSNEQNPQHIFPAIGDFDIKLFTIDEFGCKDSIIQTINIKEPPTSNFSYSLNCLDSPTEFSNQSTAGGAPISNYHWDFGDGSISTEENPQHIFSNINSYNVKLNIVNSDGCQDVYERNIVISPLPTPDFQINTNLCQFETLVFEDQSSFTIPISSYLWQFGDGQSSSLQNPSHTYQSGGDFDMSLMLIDQIGCTAEKIEARFVTPDFSLNVNYFGLCTNTPANLSGEVVSPPLVPDTWDWLFDDGSTATGQNTVYTFTQSGNHNIQLTASKNGCVEVHNQLLAVNPCPTASFQYSLISLDDTVQFIDQSTLNGGPAIVSWDWNFGDVMSGLDNFSSLQNPEHLFSHLGDFDVTLTVTDANGCSDDTTMTLTVNPRPVAGFEWDLSCFGTDVQFSDTSTTSQGFITDWWWSFGDPASGAFNSSTAQNPTHAFTAPGIYDVQLIVKAYGYDTIIQQVTIYSGASAAYSYNNPCQGSPVNFVDETVVGDAPIESWFWDFS